MIKSKAITDEAVKWPTASVLITLGVLTGITVLFGSNLPLKWGIALLMSCAVALLIAITRQSKGNLFGLLMLAFPFRIDQILLSYDYMGGTRGLRIALEDIILFALFVIILLESSTIKITWRNFYPRILIPWLLYFFISVLSYIASGCTPHGFGLIIEMMRCFAIFLVVANYFTTKKRIKMGILLLFIVIGLQSIVAIIQYYGTSLIPGLDILGQSNKIYQESWQSEHIRAGALLGGPNNLAHYFIRFLPIACALIIYRFRSVMGVLATVTFAIGSFGLILSFSRMGWIAFPISLGCIFILSMRKKGKTKVLLTSFAISIIVFSVALSSSNLITTRFFSSDNDAAYSRIPMMENSLHVIAANPVLGVGINNYAASVSKYDFKRVYRVWGEFHPVHNEILLHFAEVGIIGGIGFCWLWAVCLLEAFRCSHIKDHFVSFIALGIFAGMIAELIFMQAQWGYLEGYLPFWVGLGLCVGMRNISSQTTNNNHSSSSAV